MDSGQEMARVARDFADANAAAILGRPVGSLRCTSCGGEGYILVQQGIWKYDLPCPDCEAGDPPADDDARRDR